MDKQNWAAKLLAYQFEIVYKLGLEDKGADALSRMHDVGESSENQERGLAAMVHFP
jgi:hypothetical protein